MYNSFINKKITLKMKKHLLVFAAAIAFTLGLCSCGAVADFPGAIFMSHTKPVAVTSAPVGSKVGTVTTMNLFNLVTWGDGSVNKAAKMAGISNISHVDVKTMSVLTIFCKKTYYVYGE